MNTSKLLIAICCSLSAISAQATLLTADFRTESDLAPAGGALVYQSLGQAVGAGDELSPGPLLQNPEFLTGGVVFVDYNPGTQILTLKSRDDTDFNTFDAYISKAVFSAVGERFSGFTFLGGQLASGATPTLSFTGDSLHVQYAATPEFTFTGGTARFQVSTDLRSIPPVPEPETWAMLLGGMGLLSARLRRHRQAPRG